MLYMYVVMGVTQHFPASGPIGPVLSRRFVRTFPRILWDRTFAVENERNSSRHLQRGAECHSDTATFPHTRDTLYSSRVWNPMCCVGPVTSDSVPSSTAVEPADVFQPLPIYLLHVSRRRRNLLTSSVSGGSSSVSEQRSSVHSWIHMKMIEHLF